MGYRIAIATTEPGFADYVNEKRILEPLPAEIEIRACHTVQELIAFCRDADAILTNHAPFTKEVIDQLQRCKVIVRYGIGYDTVDIKAAAARNIPVVNVPDYGIQEVADHAVTLLLSAVRKVTIMDRNVRRGDWQIQSLGPIVGLRDKVLGLAGFGSIAKEVARRAQGFRLQVIAYDPFVPEHAFEASGVRKVDFDTLLRESDLISSHLPLNAQTAHIFDREAFRRMKSTAYLVNTSRGGVVRTSDLVWALQNGIIAGAGLDVFEQEPIAPEHPLLGLDNCVLSPHAAWYSEDASERLQRFAAMEVKRVLTGERPKHVVNGV
ncbi:C-terminal binding protein [Cohnella rhizosphaerae]|uniref:C-terminal binding protein n=1 Tax=Cohnella rhizosphaerae TaxID=1457232 RepID=A0A9X4KSR5_9BACL|nr:C-terminal binding protein [Cohnella rhizosphaerae]MDG0810018.1 C-terminal binding protein [Cohnella rhizosphaerae]